MKTLAVALVLAFSLAVPAYAVQYPPGWKVPATHDVKVPYSFHLLVCVLWGSGSADDTSHGSNSCESQDYDSFDECAQAFTDIVGFRTQQNKTSMNLFGACTQR
jgi:hypothetical protein